MSLFDINIQNGEFEVTHTSSSTSYWFPIITIIVTIILFYLKIHYDKNKEQKDKERDANNLLLYFNTLYDKIIVGSQKQSEAYKKHSENIKKNPLKFQLLESYVIGDLDRILDKFDQTRIFHAYIKKYEKEKEEIRNEKIQEVVNMYKDLDFLRRFFIEAYNSQLKYKQDLITKSIRFAEMGQEDVVYFCDSLRNKMFLTDPNYRTNPIYIALTETGEAFATGFENDKSLKYLQENGVKPIFDAVSTLLHIEYGFEIANRCRKATWLYNEILLQSEFVSQEFLAYHGQLQEKLNKVKSI
jgi:hypothetical protein